MLILASRLKYRRERNRCKDLEPTLNKNVLQDLDLIHSTLLVSEGIYHVKHQTYYRC